MNCEKRCLSLLTDKTRTTESGLEVRSPTTLLRIVDLLRELPQLLRLVLLSSAPCRVMFEQEPFVWKSVILIDGHLEM